MGINKEKEMFAKQVIHMSSYIIKKKYGFQMDITVELKAYWFPV